MPRVKKTTKEYIDTIKKRHSIDNVNYDLSKLVYKHANNPVVIIHSKYKTEHKLFPSMIHRDGIVCKIRTANDKTKYFVKRIKEMPEYDPEVMDLSYIDYVDSRTPIRIFNKKLKVFHRKTPGSIAQQGLSLGMDNAEDLVEYLKSICKQHPDYDDDIHDFSKSTYKPGEKKIKIIHKRFKTIHWVRLNDFHNSKKILTIRNAEDPTKYFIALCKEMSDYNEDVFDLSTVVYENMKSKVVYSIRGVEHRRTPSHILQYGLSLK